MPTGADCTGRSVAGIIRGTGFRITSADGVDVGLIQSFQLEFNRQLTRIYDLAQPRFYYVEGASEGTVSFNKVVGPAGAPKLACDCRASDIILNSGPTICPVNGIPGSQQITANASQFSYTLKNAMPFGLRGQGDSSNFLIIFGISYLFNDIE